MNTQRSLFFLLASVLLANTSLCQTVRVVVEKQMFKVDETFDLVFESEVDVDSVGAFTHPDLTIVSGPMRSESTQFTNGVRTYRLRVSYAVQPKAAGSLRIGPPRFFKDGKPLPQQELVIGILNLENTEA